jgi:hypothetical protein
MSQAVHSSSTNMPRINHVVAPISVERAGGHIIVKLETSCGPISHIMDTKTLAGLLSLASRCLNADLATTFAELNLP